MDYRLRVIKAMAKGCCAECPLAQAILKILDGEKSVVGCDIYRIRRHDKLTKRTDDI